MSQVQSNHGHNETLRCQNSVFGESQYKTFEHFVAHRAAGLPKQWPEVVARRLGGVYSLFELLKCYLYETNKKSHFKNFNS